VTESKLRLVRSHHHCYVDITDCINLVSIAMTIVIRSQSTLTCSVADGAILLKRILTAVPGCELVDWINLAQDNHSFNKHSFYIKESGWIGGYFLIWELLASGADFCSVELLYLV